MQEVEKANALAGEEYTDDLRRQGFISPEESESLVEVIWQLK